MSNISNRSTASAEIRVVHDLDVAGDVLVLRVERRYIYDRKNYRGGQFDGIVALRMARIAISLSDRETWGEAWSWLLDVVFVMKKAGAHAGSIILLPGLTGEVDMLYQCLVRTVAYEIGWPVVMEADEQQLELWEDASRY